MLKLTKEQLWHYYNSQLKKFEERMVPTFLTAYVCGINIVSRDRYA